MVNHEVRYFMLLPILIRVMLQHLNQTVRQSEAQDYRRHFHDRQRNACDHWGSTQLCFLAQGTLRPISSNRLTSRQVPFKFAHFMSDIAVVVL